MTKRMVVDEDGALLLDGKDVDASGRLASARKRTKDGKKGHSTSWKCKKEAKRI